MTAGGIGVEKVGASWTVLKTLEVDRICVLDLDDSRTPAWSGDRIKLISIAIGDVNWRERVEWWRMV